MTAPEQDHPGVITYPPLIFLFCLLTGLALHWLAAVTLTPHLPFRILGGALVMLAGFLAGSARSAMNKAGTNILPTKPTLAIVASGPYRFTRNPMYLALCLLHAGIALLLCWLMPLVMTAVLASILHFGVILREEKYLAAKFGPVYVNYQKSVRRWL
ncbi:MAG: isoprenylcysteine carboxylmethyltransferase family protein [Nibricoccus sp.]